MLIEHLHLPPANTGTNITHSVLIPYLTMLIMRSVVSGLRRKKNSFVFQFFCMRNNGTTTRGGDNLVSVKRQHPNIAQGATLLAFIGASQSFCRIFQNRDVIFLRYRLDFIGFKRHAIKVHGYNRFGRSEEHTSELQSRENLVCRLLLEKKKI